MCNLNEVASEISICIFLAAVLGALIGWFFAGLKCQDSNKGDAHV